MYDVVIVAAAMVALTTPANWAVRRVLEIARGPVEQIPGAGRWIGGLERLVIFVLVVAGQAGAAGLVVAAKSVLRFPEISGEHRRIDPEYVLVGSLTSWLLGFGVAVAVRAAIT